MWVVVKKEIELLGSVPSSVLRNSHCLQAEFLLIKCQGGCFYHMQPNSCVFWNVCIKWGCICYWYGLKYF